MVQNNSATETVDILAASLTKAAAAGESVLTKAYGRGTDTAAVKLALAAARQLAGITKAGQGGTAQRTNNVVKIVRDMPVQDVFSFVAAARDVLDKHRESVAATRAAAKLAAKADSDTRAAAKAVLNDRGAAKADRIAALEVMAEIDGKGDRAKSEAAYDRFVKAVESFAAAGFSSEQAAGIVWGVFEPVTVEVPALVAV